MNETIKHQGNDFKVVYLKDGRIVVYGPKKKPVKNEKA